jgi:hypothetical protein
MAIENRKEKMIFSLLVFNITFLAIYVESKRKGCGLRKSL